MVAELSFSGVRELEGAFAAIAAKVSAASPAAELEGARLIEARAEALAPARTGRLRGSIVSRIEGTVALVGPTAAYGRRVELGFLGTDSLGRHYNQIGQPYLRPAYDEATGGPLLAIFTRQWGSALRV